MLSSESKIGWSIFAFLLIVAAWIRIVIGLGDFLWLDELHTSWVVDGPISAVATRAQIGNQSPLYFWLVWPIVATLGQSEFSLRILSLVAGLFTIFAATWIAKKWTRSWLAANFVALWLALDPTFIFYATEARPYVFLQLLSVLQVYAFSQWLKNPDFQATPNIQADVAESGPPKSRAYGIGFLLATVLIFYFHYTGILIVGAEVIFVFLISFFSGNNGRFRRLGLTEIVAVFVTFSVLIVPGLVHLYSVFGQRELWVSVSNGSDLLTHFMVPVGIGVLLPLLGMTVIAFFVRNTNRASSTNSQRLNFELPPYPILVFLWIFIPILTAFLVDLFSIAPIAMPRYCVVATVGIPMFAGLMIGAIRPWMGRLIVTGLLSFFLLWNNPIIENASWENGLPRTRFEDWSILENIRTEAPDCESVFVFANVLEDQLALSNQGQQFQEYLKFPLLGRFKNHVDGMQLFSGSTLGPQHYSEEMIQHVEDLGTRPAVMIIRGTQNLINEIKNELESRCRSRLITRQYGSTGLDVQLVFVELRD